MKITIPKGDTYSATITTNGQIPVDANIIFSVAKNNKSEVLFQKEVIEDMLVLTHSDTESLDVGTYVFDFRIYTDDMTYVKTPIVLGTLEIIEVVNDDIRPDSD